MIHSTCPTVPPGSEDLLILLGFEKWSGRTECVNVSLHAVTEVDLVDQQERGCQWSTQPSQSPTDGY